MGKCKQSGVVYVVDVIRALGEQRQEIFRNALSPEDAKAAQQALAFGWMPIEQMDRIVVAAAATIYPDDPRRLYKLGRDVALDNLGGIYRVLLPLTTVPFVLSQAAKLWRTYHDQGEATSVRTEGKTEARTVVTGYPELPRDFRQLNGGYIAGVIEKTGATNIRVIQDESNPQKWVWVTTWAS